MKFLLDENISPRVAEVLRGEGVDAIGARDRGLLHASDPEVFAKAFEEDRVVVTANIGDFERLASSCDLHGGVVLLEDGEMPRTEQLETVRRVIDAIRRNGDMVNTLLRVAADGTMTFETIPPPS